MLAKRFFYVCALIAAWFDTEANLVEPCTPLLDRVAPIAYEVQP